MNIIGSTVKRVHHPTIRLIPVDCRALLHDKTGFGQKSAQCGDNAFFRLLVHIGHIVVRMLFLHRFPTETLTLFFQEAPRRTGHIADFTGQDS